MSLHRKFIIVLDGDCYGQLAWSYNFIAPLLEFHITQ